MAGDLVLGLNAYTHSASACLVDDAGRIVYAGSKERLTRRKHDGGDVAELVEHALAAVGATREDLALVVANNHLFRIDRYEATLPFAVALHQARETCLDPHNLLPGVPRLELSHHLAHAWSVLADAPFAPDLLVVMDGMGSARSDMLRAGAHYHSEFALPEAEGFREARDAEEEPYGWREAESAYLLKDGALTRLFKRWTPEPTPVFLYNYGFENMTSLGAIYSRVASQVFGDWNACGKVMGLAPWAAQWAPARTAGPLMEGPLETLRIDWERLHAEPAANRWSEEEHRPDYARLAADLQSDLEAVVLDFLAFLREQSGAETLAMAGGVALNSTLNGRIAREAGFRSVYVPPWPGDEGVAVGCARYGWQQLHQGASAPRPAWDSAAALGGAQPDEEEAVAEALADFGPWLEERKLDAAANAADTSGRGATDGPPLAELARALDEGAVLGWWQGRAEFGPRALGARCILADPREADMVERINVAVKKRERFRPFAPVVLAEHAGEWFTGDEPSPFMSLTVAVRSAQRGKIPAVVHQDGSARIQTLDAAAAEAAPELARYRGLVEAFHALTGVPMLLDTSFNVAGEPLVESARDAAWTFLRSGLDLLVLGRRVYARAPFPDPLNGDRVPLAAAFSAEVQSDNSGEALGIRVMAWGETFELSQLEFGLLEACDGEEAVGPLAERFRDEWEVDPDESVAALARLYERCLLRFG